MADETKGILSRLLTETWPAKAAGGIMDALMLPGQVAGGILNVQPAKPGTWSDEDEARSQLTNQSMMNRATDLGGLMMLGASGAPAMQNASGMGIRAYHGSPHDFDKFSMSKIGTGEGAQVYGRGLYFAEKEGVAQQYRDALSGSAIDLGGKKITPSRGSPEDIALAHLEDAHSRQFSNPWAAAYQSLLKARALAPETPSMTMRNDMDAAIAALTKWQEMGGKPTSGGHMYEVNINANRDQFLPWDEMIAYGGKVNNPDLLNKVSPLVPANKRAAFEHQTLAGLTGENIYKDILGANVRHQAPAAVNAMAEAGIPGIRYLDQGSRQPRLMLDNSIPTNNAAFDLAKEKFGIYGAEKDVLSSLAADVNRGGYGSDISKSALDLINSGRLKMTQPGGSSNYVVFDDKLIDIMRKYGLAGASPLAALMAGGNDPAQAAP